MDKILELVTKTLEEKKGIDVQVIDVSDISSTNNYFVLVSGMSARHMNSLAENVEEELKKINFDVLSIEGKKSNEWILVDLGDIVINIFSEESRDSYDLDKLWKEYRKTIEGEINA